MTFEIYFNDLTEDCQERLLEFVGVESPEEMNWDGDIIPIAIFEDVWEEDDDEDEDDEDEEDE